MGGNEGLHRLTEVRLAVVLTMATFSTASMGFYGEFHLHLLSTHYV